MLLCRKSLLPGYPCTGGKPGPPCSPARRPWSENDGLIMQTEASPSQHCRAYHPRRLRNVYPEVEHSRPSYSLGHLDSPMRNRREGYSAGDSDQWLKLTSIFMHGLVTYHCHLVGKRPGCREAGSAGETRLRPAYCVGHLLDSPSGGPLMWRGPL